MSAVRSWYSFARSTYLSRARSLSSSAKLMEGVKSHFPAAMQNYLWFRTRCLWFLARTHTHTACPLHHNPYLMACHELLGKNIVQNSIYPEKKRTRHLLQEQRTKRTSEHKATVTELVRGGRERRKTGRTCAEIKLAQVDGGYPQGTPSKK